VIEKEKFRMNLRRAHTDQNFNFNTYYRYDAINSYLEKMAALYPRIVKIDTAGLSYEGRPIKIVQISTNPSARKPIVYIDAGIHAREWIAPATALYIIHELVENSSKYRLILDTFDFIIMPLINPDGYEYSHTKVNPNKNLQCLFTSISFSSEPFVA
jgi:carboxypeptidase A2